MLLCISTDEPPGRSRIAGPPDERRRKAGQSGSSNREGHAGWAGLVKTFRKAGDPAKRDRRAVSKRQPESEEARPVAPGERAAKSGG